MNATPGGSRPVGGVTPPRAASAVEIPNSRGEGTPPTTENKPAVPLTPAQRRHILLISLLAVALYAGLRSLPTGTNLHSQDFSVSGKGALEMCDPANPQFIPVVAVRSPVTMTLRGDTPSAAGRATHFTLTLQTSTGKPIAPVDLLESHTRKLHLLITDPTLRDYQHVHPEPGAQPGEWEFTLTPRLAGTYRVFADFTPAVTARGLYASADFEAAAGPRQDLPTPGNTGVIYTAWAAQVDGCQFHLKPAAEPVRAGQVTDLSFSVARADGHPAVLEPVMGALAHLVAFDSNRNGFAHLHPFPITTAVPAAAAPARLAFKVTIPNAGRYVIWAQVRVGGREIFAPFWFEVVP